MHKEVPKDTGIKEGSNYTPWKEIPVSRDRFESLTDRQKLLHLCLLGHLGLSTHNTQPWIFKPDEKEKSIEILLNRERVLPGSDKKGRQALISLGTAVTNIGVGAVHFGLSANLKFLGISPEKLRPLNNPNAAEKEVPVARINFAGGIACEENPLYNAIFTRRVDRREYDRTRGIPEETEKKIKAADSTEVKLHTLKRGDPRITIIAELQSQADGFVANNPEFAKELGQWIHENDTESPLGMPGDTFNLTADMAKEIKSGLLGKTLLKADHISGLTRSSQRGIESAALLGMISVDKDTPDRWLKAGMVLGKSALVLESDGISMAVNAGLAEAGEYDFSIVDVTLKLLALSSNKIVALFRAGYPKHEDRVPHSPRLPLEQVVS